MSILLKYTLTSSPRKYFSQNLMCSYYDALTQVKKLPIFHYHVMMKTYYEKASKFTFITTSMSNWFFYLLTVLINLYI